MVSKEKVISFFALFGSTGTLVCCALPAAMAAIAGGAAIGTLLSAFPWLIPISRHKEWIFLIAGGLIVFNGILVLRPKGRLACSITGGKGCEVASGFTKGMLWVSIWIYSFGAFFAYALVPVLKLLGG
jgi:mercuric ion transport protein